MYCRNERLEKCIEFRDANDLNRVIYTHSVGTHQPGVLCAASPTVLLYEDFASNRREVHWLDCSTIPPKPVKGRNVTHTELDQLTDICCTHDGIEQLLVLARYVRNDCNYLHIHGATTDQVLHRISYELPGERGYMGAAKVAVDSRGFLYICDFRKECIQLFTQGGTYLGCLMTKGDRGLGVPCEIRWCENLSCLVVLHKRGESDHESTRCYISVVSVY